MTTPDWPPGVTFARRAAYLPAADALVVADLHVGRAADSNVTFPVGERGDLLDRLRANIDRFEPGEVVVAGDLLHSFGRLPPAVAEAVDELRAAVEGAGATLVVTPGNHDTLLAKVFDGQTAATYRLDGGTVVCHGHEVPDAAADRYVVGHDHPAIEIEGARHPCFLYGEGVHRGADVLVLPAFSRAVRGAVVNRMRGEDVLSPVLSELDACRPVVYDDDAGQALTFPPLGRFRNML